MNPLSNKPLSTIEDYIDARMREALLAFKEGLRAEAKRIEESQSNCSHEVCTRDICNMATCVACGAALGIGYSEFDRVPAGEYWGISRTMDVASDKKGRS